MNPALEGFSRIIGEQIGDPDLVLQHHDIEHLGLFNPEFPIEHLRRGDGFLMHRDPDPLKVWGVPFFTLPDRYKMEFDQRWGGRYCRNPEIHEEKTVLQMLHSLLSEPIRRPIEVCMMPGVGNFVYSGNNRVGASVLTGRATIPARAIMFMWTADDTYPGDDAAREAWRAVGAESRRT